MCSRLNVPLFYERVLKYWEEGSCLAVRLILIQTKHSSGATNTLKSTKKLCFFPAWYHKGIYKIKDLISDNGKFLPFDVFLLHV